MAFIVLFSFVLLALSLPVGTGTRQRCIMHMTSKYSSVLQYCSLESIQDETKETVCDEIFSLFEKFCSFNRSGFPLPEPQNVSKENCALLCAGLDLKYILSMFNITSGSCQTSCTVDPEAGAVLLTLFQLKGLIDELEPKKEKTVATNSTLAQSKQIISTSKATVTPKPKEPDVSSTTAALNPKSKEPDVSSTAATVTPKPKEPDVSSPAAAVTTKTKEPDVSSTTAAGKNDSAPKEDVMTTTAASGRTNPSSTKHNVKSDTTASGRTNPSSTKHNVKSDTTVKWKITPKGEDVGIETNTTVQGKTTPKGEDVETTTTVQGKTTPKGEDVETTTTVNGQGTESDGTDEDYVNGQGTESGGTDEDHGSNKIKEQPISDNGQGLTDEKDDTPSSYHFLIYFLAFIVLCVASYIVFHNKHKIIAFVIEGKQGRRGGRPSTKQYTPLKSKVEDVMPSIEKSTTQSNYIY